MIAYSNIISTRIYFNLWSLFSFSCLIVHNLKMRNSFISFPKAIDHIISRRCYFFTENKCLKRNKILEPRSGTVSLHAFICSIRKRRKWWLLDKHTSQIFVTDFLHHETKKSENFFQSWRNFWGGSSLQGEEKWEVRVSGDGFVQQKQNLKNLFSMRTIIWSSLIPWYCMCVMIDIVLNPKSGRDATALVLCSNIEQVDL